MNRASRLRSEAVVSTSGRSKANERRSPFTLYCHAGNVTLRSPTAFPNREANQLQNFRVGVWLRSASDGTSTRIVFADRRSAAQS
jgi:hypothetical protein